MPRANAPNDVIASHERTSGSEGETRALGAQVGAALEPGDVVALYGPLGSGKTTLIQGIAQGSGRQPDVVKSPTFVLQREYPGAVPLVHVDGYRLDGAEEAAWLDVELIFSPRKITLIEWAERFEGLLPADVLQVHLNHVSTNRRHIALRGTGPRSTKIISQLHSNTAADSV